MDNPVNILKKILAKLLRVYPSSRDEAGIESLQAASTNSLID